jgi:predicted lipid carrier protein YhbT
MATGDHLASGIDLDTLDTIDLGSVAPETFARVVKAIPARRAAQFMAGPQRGRVLDEVFRRMETLFRPEAAPGRETLVRWRITADGGGMDTYETVVGAGRLVATRGATDRAPRLTLTMAAPELLALAAGCASGPVLFLTRRLKAQGDLLLAASLTRWFDLPRV